MNGSIVISTAGLHHVDDDAGVAGERGDAVIVLEPRQEQPALADEDQVLFAVQVA